MLAISVIVIGCLIIIIVKSRGSCSESRAQNRPLIYNYNYHYNY